MSNPSAFPWADEPEARTLFSIFAQAKKKLRFVGGAVRDGIMKLPVIDLDAATTARPEDIIAILKTADIRAIPTGIDHGTITAVFEKRAVEITTLRVDTLCDGRHADVAYTDNWEEDAARRDFTINALYLDEQGTIHDYFNGLKDIAERRVRFIGDASARIAEDYLRTLRFFRFLATHGTAPADEAALQACKAAKDKLGNLSGERIQKEMLKLLSAENPVYALTCMQDTGVLEEILGHAAVLSDLPLLLSLEKETSVAPHSLLRLALILEAVDSNFLAARWRLSNQNTKLLALLMSHPVIISEAPYLPLKRAIREYGAETATLFLLHDTVKQSLSFAAITAPLDIILTWQPPAFPITGEDLIAAGYKPGKDLGDQLKKLEMVWEESDYTLSKAELLKQL